MSDPEYCDVVGIDSGRKHRKLKVNKRKQNKNYTTENDNVDIACEHGVDQQRCVSKLCNAGSLTFNDIKKSTDVEKENHRTAYRVYKHLACEFFNDMNKEEENTVKVCF